MSEPAQGPGPGHKPSMREVGAWRESLAGLRSGDADAAAIAGAMCVSVVGLGGHRRRSAPESPPSDAGAERWAVWRERAGWVRQQNMATLRALLGAMRQLADASASAGVEQLREHVYEQWGVHVNDVPAMAQVEYAARAVLAESHVERRS